MAGTTEGTIPFRGFEAWYRVVGAGEEPGKLPLLCLHGGPGACHDYLESLETFAATGRRVVFYDQLGCGKSSRTDESFWNVGTFVEEVGAVRAALGLGESHLFGSSWGGMLAMEYALTRLTLVTSRRHDEWTPVQGAAGSRSIRGFGWVVFEESSHMQFAEEPERYRQVLDDFLTRVETGR